MDTNSINQRIAEFQEHFGEAHLYFAYHAAFPFAMTSDLGYHLWSNFQRDKDGNLLKSKRGRILQIPWIAVADLLLFLLRQQLRSYHNSAHTIMLAMLYYQRRRFGLGRGLLARSIT